MLNVSDIGRAAEFLSKGLGYVPHRTIQHFSLPRVARGPRLHLDEDDRTHLDLWVDRQDSDLLAEVEGLISLGGRRVDWDNPEDADFVVLADTEGNLFCVIA